MKSLSGGDPVSHSEVRRSNCAPSSRTSGTTLLPGSDKSDQSEHRQGTLPWLAFGYWMILKTPGPCCSRKRKSGRLVGTQWQKWTSASSWTGTNDLGRGGWRPGTPTPVFFVRWRREDAERTAYADYRSRTG